MIMCQHCPLEDNRDCKSRRVKSMARWYKKSRFPQKSNDYIPVYMQ